MGPVPKVPVGRLRPAIGTPISYATVARIWRRHCAATASHRRDLIAAIERFIDALERPLHPVHLDE
jgi:hypothetical protein